MSAQSIETGTLERAQKIRPKLTWAITPYQKALYSSTDTRGRLKDMLQHGRLEESDFTVSGEYDLGQLNTVRRRGHLDTKILVPLDEESLPPAAVFRIYFGPLGEDRQDKQPLKFAVVRGGVAIDPSRLASVQLDPDFEAYYELQRPQGESRRFHLVLR